MGGRDSQDGISGGLVRIPDPPMRLEFSCPCGKRLVATRECFDRRSRCGSCRTILLLNLVYQRDLGIFQIEPFRVEPDTL